MFSIAPRRRTLRPVLLLLAAAAFLAACDDGSTPVSTEVTVMTRNIYLGANIFRLTQAQQASDLPVIAAEIFGILGQNDYPARAGALAAEIEANDPDLVGLQEVTLYRIQDPSDYVTGTTDPNATTVHLDFLQILLDSLDARGLDYTVASQVTNADVELPAAESQTEFFDVRLTDRDVILARADIATGNPGADGFDVIVPFVLASGDTVFFERGYTWVNARKNDVNFTFVNTHFEISAGGQLTFFQNRQAEELINRFRGIDPIVVVGDFNTEPGANPYSLLTGAFSDVWPAVGAGDGLTCCQPEFLSMTEPLTERIDLILYRGAIEPLSATVIGDDPADRTSGGLWPSDHAGVVATLRIEN